MHSVSAAAALARAPPDARFGRRNALNPDFPNDV
jgi:hypothetical protein